MSGRESIPIRWREAVLRAPLQATTKAVALVLSTFINLDGQAHPSQQTIGERASLSDTAVRKHLRLLVKAGFLTVIPRYGRGSDRYQVCIPNQERPNLSGPASEPHARRAEPASEEVVESVQEVEMAAPPAGATASVVITDWCMGCDQKFPMHHLNSRSLCPSCAQPPAAHEVREEVAQ